jgi:hypothetical protein
MICLKPSLVLCFGHATLQHPDRGQEILPPGSQRLGKDRVGNVCDVKAARPLLLIVNASVEEVNLQMQVRDERPQFRGGAEIVQLRSEMKHPVHGSAPFWHGPIMGLWA